MRKVMAFGVFDGVHEGHRIFLRAARAYGDYLVIALARDNIVERLKGRAPKRNFDERAKDLSGEKLADEIVSGDDALGVYDVIKLHRPQVIALGYDQGFLKDDLAKHLGEFDRDLEIKVMEPHEPERLHSSILNPGS